MNKQYNAQESTKFLQISYSIESIDSDSDCVITNFNLEDIDNYNTWNHLTVCKHMINSKLNDSDKIEILETIWLWGKMSSDLFKNVFGKLFTI